MSANAITSIYADWQAPAHVKAFNTTRTGGLSQPPFDELNLAMHVADEPVAVAENRRRIKEFEHLPAEPYWLNQVHGCQVKTAPFAPNINNEADAAFTDETNQVLCVMTADCLPVAITNESGTELAVAHAGWKGLAGGVIEASLEKFTAGEPLHVWFGPAIGPNCFEVGNEVMEAFVKTDSEQNACFQAHPSHADKKFADIYGLARRIVQRSLPETHAGVSFSGGQWCTVSDAARFHSYRRDGAKSGRMALVAWLAESP